MKIRVSICLVLGGLLVATGWAASKKESHPFFKCGWASGGPALYDGKLKLRWEQKDGRELSDGWYLPDGGIVFSFSTRRPTRSGVIRLDKNKKQLWEYVAPNEHDNHSCQPLPHGGFLLGECAKDGLWMVEIDKNGKELKRIRVADSAQDPHHAFRMVRKTKKGTYLGTLMRGGKTDGKTLAGRHAYEWDAAGKLIHTFPTGGFFAIRLKNGNTLVSEGAGRGSPKVLITEYSPNNKVVWELTETDLEKAGIAFGMVCGFQRLPNGNTVVTNVKHGKHTIGAENGDFPKAFEITSDKKVVWKVPAATSSKNMASIQLLDVRGNPYKFEIFR